MPRKQRSLKRDGTQTSVVEVFLGSRGGGVDVEALDEALKSLSDVDPRKARAVELRFFGGLSVQETAEVLGISVETVTRDWRVAKAWLSRELGQSTEARQ